MLGKLRALNKTRASNVVSDQLEKVKLASAPRMELTFRVIKCQFERRKKITDALPRATASYW